MPSSLFRMSSDGTPRIVEVTLSTPLFRPCGASSVLILTTHGLRRGLHSFAPSGLRLRPMESQNLCSHTSGTRVGMPFGKLRAGFRLCGIVLRTIPLRSA
jgi:hypothetical protein